MPSDTLQAEALLIDSKQLQTLTGLGQRKVWELTNCNAVPHKRIGRLVKYDPVEIRAWIAAGCPCDPGAAIRIRKEMKK